MLVARWFAFCRLHPNATESSMVPPSSASPQMPLEQLNSQMSESMFKLYDPSTCGTEDNNDAYPDQNQ